MKIITYSDLHFEFGSDWLPPRDIAGDVMILAGDIITLKSYGMLERFLKGWDKPVLYVTGNHEYYTQRPMGEENDNFRKWLNINYPNVTLLMDEDVSIDGIHFFGGTMWTNFNGADRLAMETAQHQMNDFRLIVTDAGRLLAPGDTVAFHERFVERLTAWFEKDLPGPRVVISHHAPAINPDTRYRNSPLMPAFNSLDMIAVIEKYQPALWVYGHTHECDDQMIGKTRVISNQLGYPNGLGGFECPNFDRRGKPVDILQE